MIPALQLQFIDDSNRQDHDYLEQDDKCYFYGEYTPVSSYQGSAMNSLILNFKKTMDKKDNKEWQHKKNAIKEISEIVINLEAWHILRNYTWIPIPPSKNRQDPLFDDRLVQVLQKIKENNYNPLDFREIVDIKASRNAAHQNSGRLSPEEHYNNFKINPSGQPPPDKIIIFDDVITTGSGFKAMKKILNKSYPLATIIGVFIVRTSREANPKVVFGDIN